MTPFMSLDHHQMACNGMPPSFFSQNFLLQMQQEEEEHQHQHQQQPGIAGIQASAALGKRSMSFSGINDVDDMNGGVVGGVAGAGDDDLSDDCSQAGERKRRLSMEQVRTLERNFELGNKLEPERKLQLARSLGLQPRQIAIWFQNRRARWKTKQLEKDYDALRRQFDALRSENESLQAHNKKLQAEITAMKGRETLEPINLNKETEGSCSNRSENSSGEANPEASAPAPATHEARPPFFAAAPAPMRPVALSMTQLLQSASRSELGCFPKAEPAAGAPPEESFGNIFCGVDDQPPFWSWNDQHSFH